VHVHDVADVRPTEGMACGPDRSNVEPLQDSRGSVGDRKTAPTAKAGPDGSTMSKRTISIDGPLTDEQRGALLSIADRCPVHRTLEGSVVVSTNLAATMPAAA